MLTTDAGTSWKNVSGGLRDKPARRTRQLRCPDLYKSLPLNHGMLQPITEFYYTRDAGATWGIADRA